MSLPDTIPQNEPSSRHYDVNGWPEIKDNPLSKVGVFPYIGSSLGPEYEPDKIYMVYRSEEELSDPDTINSFKILPWTDEHPTKLLGSESAGRIPAEKKGVHGVTGQEIYYKDGILYGNIKMFGEGLQNLVDSGEKKEISLGYGCRYELSSGIWNGKRYDVKQVNIRGNHLASVPQGRMGPDVAVLDHLTFTFDAKDIHMAEEPEKELTMDEVTSWMKENGPKMSKMQAMVDKHFGGDKSAKDAEEKEKEEAEKAAKDAEEKEKADKEASDKCAADKAAKDAEEAAKKEKDGMDSAFKALNAKIEALEKGGVKAIFSQIKQRDELARKISQHVGAFDHSEMTVSEVAAYGVKKLGLKCPDGTEAVALDGYFTNRVAPSAEIGFALDDAGAPVNGVQQLDKIFGISA